MKRAIVLIILIGFLFFSCTTTTSFVSEDEQQVEFAISKMVGELLLAKETITSEEQVEMLTYLASDELEGRSSGEKGNQLAAEYIAKEFEEYGLIKGMGNSYFQEFEVTYKGEKITTSNVVGYFKGNDTTLKNEVIVVGAHFDHIGLGYYGTQKVENRGKIHNGADDNASGTVGLLEIADAISRIKDKINRTIVFIAFSAEEMGLCGSQYYVNNPIFPLKNTIFMFNFDMIGWLKGKDFVYSIDTKSSLIKTIMRKVDDNYPFKIRFVMIWGGSDHYPFYQENIPTSFLNTDLHKVYQTPDDDGELIDFDGLKLITTFAYETLCLVDLIPERPIIASNH
jgi:hypothetical protein